VLSPAGGGCASRAGRAGAMRVPDATALHGAFTQTYASALDAAASVTSAEERAFYGLAGAYGLVALVAAVQLGRIQARVPEYGWTTQKVFHMLNFAVASLRCGVFLFRESVEGLKPAVLSSLLMDLPGTLFFTTYTLLVLFWAEIYHQARSLPTRNLRPAFVATNAAVYLAQVAMWVYMGLVEGEGGGGGNVPPPPVPGPTGEAAGGAGGLWGVSPAAADSRYDLVRKGSACFLAAVSVAAAAGFAVYGGRLFLMLRRFPIESRGRRKKLREVGLVTAVCSTCFTTRAVLEAFSAFSHALEVDLLNHTLLGVVYYTCTEVLPSALVLFILRKLPPKRAAGGYHAIS